MNSGVVGQDQKITDAITHSRNQSLRAKSLLPGNRILRLVARFCDLDEDVRDGVRALANTEVSGVAGAETCNRCVAAATASSGSAKRATSPARECFQVL
jgi:hypothetical protein